MELEKIQLYLDSPDVQERMRGIVELRRYSPEIVVPLLKKRMYDKEILIRSFVAIGLGRKKNEEAFEALLELIESDRDYTIIAEAANSLAQYGEKSLPYLVKLFKQYNHWLIRHSILAATENFNNPETTLKLCIWAVKGKDVVVTVTAISTLAQLAVTNQASEALKILLSLVEHREVEIRAKVASVLHLFNFPEAKEALAKLRQDSNYRVIGATLEGLV
jgi:HEAT repeat protein